MLRDDEPDIADPETEPGQQWGRRRGNLRHAVSVPALLIDHRGTPVRCAIEDVSLTGMAVSIDRFTPEPGREPLEPASTATLEFPCATGDLTGAVSTPVSVVWRTPAAVGIRFLDMTPALKATLREIAAAAVSSRLDAGATRRPALSPEQRRILRACRRTVQKRLPNLVWVMRTELATQLRLLAHDAAPAEAGAARNDAADLETHAMGIARTVEHEVLAGFSEASDLDETQELTVVQVHPHASQALLRVLDDSASAHDARVTALAHTVEERCKAQFFELDVRLANVLGHRLDTRTNPLVPGALCRILWHAVTSSCHSPRLEQVLQQVMVQRVTPLIGELYEAMNATLDESGAERVLDVRREPPEHGA